MSIEEADEEIAKSKSGQDAPPKESSTQQNEKEKLDSPPHSPGKEKGDDEKDVVLDIPTSEVPLRDSPSSSPLPPLPPEDFATCRRRMLTRVLLLLFIQWFFTSLACILVAITFGPTNRYGSLDIVLTALVSLGVLGHLAFYAVMRFLGKMKNAPCVIPNLVVNLGHFGFLTFILVVILADLTVLFSDYWFNIIALTVVLSLGIHLVCIFQFKCMPRVRCVLNASLGSAVFAAFIFGVALCYDPYDWKWRGLTFIGLLISVVVGTIVAAGLIIKAILLTEDKTVVNAIKIDFGASAVIGIYRSTLDKLWAVTVGEELLDRF